MSPDYKHIGGIVIKDILSWTGIAVECVKWLMAPFCNCNYDHLFQKIHLMKISIYCRRGLHSGNNRGFSRRFGLVQLCCHKQKWRHFMLWPAHCIFRYSITFFWMTVKQTLGKTACNHGINASKLIGRSWDEINSKMKEMQNTGSTYQFSNMSGSICEGKKETVLIFQINDHLSKLGKVWH